MTPRPPIPTDPAAIPLVNIEGSITNAHGKPIAEAIIDIDPLSGDRAFPARAIISNEHGRYEWPVEPGRYAVTVFASGYYSQTQRVEVRSGPPLTVDFALTSP